MSIHFYNDGAKGWTRALKQFIDTGELLTAEMVAAIETPARADFQTLCDLITAIDVSRQVQGLPPKRRRPAKRKSRKRKSGAK